MQTVKEIIDHILYHVNAEAADSDPSQKGDVQARAAYVRSVLQPYEQDSRKIEKYDLLREVSRDAKVDSRRAGFRRLLANLEATEIASPRSAIQDWIARGTERDKP